MKNLGVEKFFFGDECLPDCPPFNEEWARQHCLRHNFDVIFSTPTGAKGYNCAKDSLGPLPKSAPMPQSTAVELLTPHVNNNDNDNVNDHRCHNFTEKQPVKAKAVSVAEHYASYNRLLEDYGGGVFKLLNESATMALLHEIPAVKHYVDNIKSTQLFGKDIAVALVKIGDGDIINAGDTKHSDTRFVSAALFSTMINLVDKVTDSDVLPSDFHTRLCDNAANSLRLMDRPEVIGEQMIIAGAAEFANCVIHCFTDEEGIRTRPSTYNSTDKQFLVIKHNNQWYGTRIVPIVMATASSVDSNRIKSTHVHQIEKNDEVIKSSLTLSLPSSQLELVSHINNKKRTLSDISATDDTSAAMLFEMQTEVVQFVGLVIEKEMYSDPRLEKNNIKNFQKQYDCLVICSLRDFVSESGENLCDSSNAELMSPYATMLRNVKFPRAAKCCLVSGKHGRPSRDRMFQSLNVILQTFQAVELRSTAIDLLNEFEQQGRMLVHHEEEGPLLLEFFLLNGFVKKNKDNPELISVSDSCYPKDILTGMVDKTKPPDMTICRRLFHDYFNNWFTFPSDKLISDPMCWQVLAIIYNVNITVYFESGEPTVKCEVRDPGSQVEFVRRTAAHHYQMLAVVSNASI